MEHHALNDRHTTLAAGAPGEFEAAYKAATCTAGVGAVDGRIVVRAIGEDRLAFFHGMCTADVKNAKPRSILPALILTEHAHIIAELFIWVAGDALLLDIDATAWTRARAHLEKLLVADDVEFEEADAFSVVDIEGPQSPAVAKAVGGDEAGNLPAWRFVAVGDLCIGNFPRFGATAISILVPHGYADDLVNRAISAVPGARQIDSAVLEAIRIEHGIARIGADTTEKSLALEARLERAISFHKGCYVGQETIERATARGALKKRMMGLRFEDGKLPGIGSAVTLAGKDAGHVTSVVRSPRMGAIGLAMLHHSAWPPGTRVAVADGASRLEASVYGLPFEG
ncbi:MAG TPA: glycine cleavage T C-terminal barrel domain-containing protein [Candidatus Binataceae bacterium]|nr:glycine cleavage T C-terminal barrel domain-containing protein [Candidatus Binataceae bacterium]